MVKTIIGADIERRVIGYMVNAELDPDNQNAIKQVQDSITNEFGEAVWAAPRDSLHITLLDWLAPLVDYGRDKTELFDELQEQYDQALTRSLARVSLIAVRFTTISVGQSAIFISGRDNGEFAQVRNDFIENVTLLPDTKLPPTIIHSTIARFKEEVDLGPIQDFVSQLSIDFVQPVSQFRLVKESVDPMLEFETIKEYPLGQI